MTTYVPFHSDGTYCEVAARYREGQRSDGDCDQSHRWHLGGTYRYRVATDAETADYLAGYASYLDAIETEHGLVLPAREENCQV